VPRILWRSISSTAAQIYRREIETMLTHRVDTG
jgi:hypothetical protein